MQTPTIPDNSRERPGASVNRPVITEPTFEGEPKPIAEFIAQPDFPQSAYGQFVDIGGYAGVVVEITNQSIRVRSADKIIQSFNIHVLRRLYGPRQQPAPEPASSSSSASSAPLEKEAEAARPAPKKEIITEPDFERPLKPITDFAWRSDFPKCALGEFVDISGFKGVVVEIVNQSVKVKSQQDITRSYGVSTLRSLYGRR
jgi:hypothetical protein